MAACSSLNGAGLSNYPLIVSTYSGRRPGAAAKLRHRFKPKIYFLASVLRASGQEDAKGLKGKKKEGGKMYERGTGSGGLSVADQHFHQRLLRPRRSARPREGNVCFSLIIAERNAAESTDPCRVLRSGSKAKNKGGVREKEGGSSEIKQVPPSPLEGPG